jgi:hypothetical protein
MHEDIGSLEISMRNSHFPQVAEALIHVEYYLVHLGIREGLLSPDSLLQIALVA